MSKNCININEAFREIENIDIKTNINGIYIDFIALTDIKKHGIKSFNDLELEKTFNDLLNFKKDKNNENLCS